VARECAADAEHQAKKCAAELQMFWAGSSNRKAARHGAISGCRHSAHARDWEPPDQP